MANNEVYPIIVPNQFGLKSVNFYLVTHEQGLSLIDAGYNDETCWGALINTLKQNNLELQDLTEILLTHHHVDHIGLVNRILSEHQLPVYASPLSIPRLKRERDFMERRVDFFARLYSEMGCGKMGEKQVSYLVSSIEKNKDRAIYEEIITIKDSKLLHFEVLEIPGHAPDQLAFWDTSQNYLFAGDLLIEHISSNALIEPDEQGEKIPSLSQHIDSLKRIQSLNTEVIFSGHGRGIHQPHSLIEKRLTRIEEKSNFILQLIQSGYSTGNALALKLYKGKYETEFGLVMSEVIGHLDYLEWKKKVSKDLSQGIWHYTVI